MESHKRRCLLVGVFFVSNLCGSEDSSFDINKWAKNYIPIKVSHHRSHSMPTEILLSDGTTYSLPSQTSTEDEAKISAQIVPPDLDSSSALLGQSSTRRSSSSTGSPYTSCRQDPHAGIRMPGLHEPFDPYNPYKPLRSMFQSTGFDDEDLYGSRRRRGSFSFDHEDQDETIPSRILILNEGKIPRDLTLFSAVESGTEEQVHLLVVETNVDIEQVDKNGKTVLHCATEKALALLQFKQHKPEGIRGLLSSLLPIGPSTEQTNQEERRIISIVRLLVRHNANINKVDSNGQTVLQKASQSGYLTLIKLFLTSPAVNVNKVDSQGRSALHFAAAQDHREIIKRLIKAGAQDVIDQEGQSCLDVTKDGKTGQFMRKHWKEQAKKDRLEEKEQVEVKELKRSLKETQFELRSALFRERIYRKQTKKSKEKLKEYETATGLQKIHTSIRGLKGTLSATRTELTDHQQQAAQEFKQAQERLSQLPKPPQQADSFTQTTFTGQDQDLQHQLLARSIQSTMQEAHSVREAIGQTRQTVVDYQHQSARELTAAKEQVREKIAQWMHQVQQNLEDQLREAQQEVERLTNRLEDQTSLTHSKEEELKEIHQQLEEAKQEVDRLRALVQPRREDDRSESPSTTVYHHETHVHGDSPVYHGNVQQGDQYSGEQVVRGDVGLLKGDESRNCCNHWLCKIFCCFKCCRRCRDSCKDMKFKWGLNPC